MVRGSALFLDLGRLAKLSVLTIASEGHTCLFQYSFLHLTGYKAMTFDQLKSYHSDRVDALCPGHPEIEHEGVEVTTGPLGQGIANAVGMAMATKNLAATYNRPGFDVVNNHTWCMIGDACLQEGVGLEAISLAGHFRLNNLTVIYDNNQITCDGSVDLTNTEDVNAKMRACGWDVIDVEDGCFDIEAIVRALEQARASKEKPTFINVRTVIGLDSAVAGTATAHGAAFGINNVAEMKKLYGFNPEEHFVIGDVVRQFFQDVPARGEQHVQEWNQLVSNYTAQNPELGAEFQARVRGELPADWKQHIPSSFPEKPTASRASSGLVFNPIAKECKNFMVGTADLSPSVNMIWPGKVDFQHVSLNRDFTMILHRTDKRIARPAYHLRHQR
jgi:dihydroxyacetone synthase